MNESREKNVKGGIPEILGEIPKKSEAILNRITERVSGGICKAIPERTKEGIVTRIIERIAREQSERISEILKKFSKEFPKPSKEYLKECQMKKKTNNEVIP